MATQPQRTDTPASQSPFELAATRAIATLFSTDPKTTVRQRDASAHLLLDAVEHNSPTAARASAQLLRAYQTGRLHGRVLHRYNCLLRSNIKRSAAVNDNAGPVGARTAPPAATIAKKRERSIRDAELRKSMRGTTNGGGSQQKGGSKKK